MKTKFSFGFLVILFIYITIFSKATYCQEEIIYDALEQRFTTFTRYVSSGKSVKFVINNVNPFIFNIVINKQLLRVQAPTPKSMSYLFDTSVEEPVTTASQNAQIMQKIETKTFKIKDEEKYITDLEKEFYNTEKEFSGSLRELRNYLTRKYLDMP